METELRSKQDGALEISRLALLTAEGGEAIRSGDVQDPNAEGRTFVCLGITVHAPEGTEFIVN